ncbi:hypothetical protein BDR03DRAFT_1096431 [Suillus americanus]|nr:hypothetical protein BDR03DRAFT_1096431 [Suillus americanus]
MSYTIGSGFGTNREPYYGPVLADTWTVDRTTGEPDQKSGSNHGSGPDHGSTNNICAYALPRRGLDLHVERLTVSAPLFRQNPASFPWVTPPFPVTDPGEKIIRSDGVSFN